MDNEASHRGMASDFWQLCNEYERHHGGGNNCSGDGGDDAGRASSSSSSSVSSQHSDGCTSDPDGFVYPPSNHSSPTVVGVAIKRSLKVADDANNGNVAFGTKANVLNDNNNSSAPIVVFVDDEVDDVDGHCVNNTNNDDITTDDDDEEEGVDIFYECNNNNTTKIASPIASNAPAVTHLINGNDSAALTDLFLKKYHAHNELIEHNYYRINTKKIDETINLIDLNDGSDVFRPVVLNSSPTESQVVTAALQQLHDQRQRPDESQHTRVADADDRKGSNRQPANTINGYLTDHNGDRHSVVDADAATTVTTTTVRPTSPHQSLLDLSNDSFCDAVDSLLGDTVCTNHLIADVRDDFERLKVNVKNDDDDDLLGIFANANGHSGPVTSDDDDDNEQNESDDPQQLVNLNVNQSGDSSHGYHWTHNSQLTVCIEEEDDDSQSISTDDEDADKIADQSAFGKHFFFYCVLFFSRITCCFCCLFELDAFNFDSADYISFTKLVMRARVLIVVNVERCKKRRPNQNVCTNVITNDRYFVLMICYLAFLVIFGCCCSFSVVVRGLSVCLLNPT